jgi:hypothetical protein
MTGSASAARPANGDSEVSIILEGYNHGEGSSLDRLRGSLRAAVRTAIDYGSAEILLADPSGDPEVTAMLDGELAAVRRVDATGLPYDEAKALAISEARGEFILLMDGDVIPDRDDWVARHVSVLRRGAAATSGFTRYEGGFFQMLCSVMDFGYLLPVADRDLRCYASNNTGFRRETLTVCPVAEGPLRCNCYQHADELRRRGTPVRMVTDVPVTHEAQPFWEERFRRGHDQIAACWTNPELPESRLTKLGPLAAPLFYGRDVWLDWRRIARGHRDLGLGRAKTALGIVLFPLLRLPDLAGMVRALVKRRKVPLGRPQTTESPVSSR